MAKIDETGVLGLKASQGVRRCRTPKPGNWQSVFDEINSALLKYKSS